MGLKGLSDSKGTQMRRGLQMFILSPRRSLLMYFIKVDEVFQDFPKDGLGVLSN